MKRTTLLSAITLIQIGVMSAVNPLTVALPEPPAACNAHFTWSQTGPNVISFTDTSSKGTTASTTYQWSYGDGTFSSGQNPVHTYNVPGHYMVCLKIAGTGGCHSIFCDTLNVTGTVICNLTVHTGTRNADCAICQDGAAGVTFILGGTPPYTYLWTPGGATTRDIFHLNPGIYTVCVTDKNGCKACSTDTVKLRTSSCTANFTWTQGAPNILAFNDAASVAGTHAHYHWSFGDGQNANGQNPSHTYNVPGTYTACLTITDTGCCHSEYCAVVQVTGTVICDLTVNPASHSASCDTCHNGSAAVYVNGGSAPYTYLWSNGATTPVVHHLAPGTYTVCVTDSNKCKACTMVTVTGRHPHCSADFDMKRDTGKTVQYTAVNESWGKGPLTYTWTWGDGSAPDNTKNPTHTYTTPGDYQICLTITDSVGCSSTDCDMLYDAHSKIIGGATSQTITVNVVSPSSVNGIVEEHMLGSWNMYPNPTSGVTIISYTLTQSTALDIRVYDLTGKEVMQIENKASASAGNYQTQINAGALQAGTYFLNIRTSSGTESKRLTVTP